MSMIRVIIELPEDAVDGEDKTDAITDVLIEAFDTPHVQVLDIVEEGEPAWHRTSRF